MQAQKKNASLALPAKVQVLTFPLRIKISMDAGAERKLYTHDRGCLIFPANPDVNFM